MDFVDKGAHFYRCDFQVHTPRDRSWKGKSYVTDAERKEYGQKLIAACREKALHAIAITDHHDLCFTPYIMEAAREEILEDGTPVPDGDRILVFPGIELTLNVPCQAILILDADFPSTLLPQVLTALAITPSSEGDAKASEVIRLDSITTLEELKQKLDEHEFLRNRYIILPNVTSGGSDTLLRDGVANKYKSMPCVGGYLDGSISKCDVGDLNILNGQVKHYGNKRIALIQTSDTRSNDHDSLGKHSTWIKWSTPTAEALRQACLAQESRISQEKPTLPSVIIKSIQVSNSEFMGPIDLYFNPQYTAIIGSRGTGKSTILEYLRWALCDEHDNEGSEDGSNQLRVQQRNLVDNTLKKFNASVEVRFDVNGVPHLVRRKSTGEILLRIDDGELEECDQEDIKSLLPIQAYSQKQLSRVGVRFDELDRFVKSGIKTNLDTISSKTKSVTSKIRQIYSQVRRKQVLENALREDKLALESLNKQAKTIRDSLTGLTDEQREIISKQPDYLSAEILVEQWDSELTETLAAISELSDYLKEIPATSDLDISLHPESKILIEVRDVIQKNVQQLQESVAVLENKIGELINEDGEHLGEYEDRRKKWSAAKAKYDQEYQIAKSAASAHETQLKSLAEIEDKIKTISKRISSSHNEIDSLGKPENEFVSLREQWIGLHKEKGDLYVEQCGKLTELSDGIIRATALRGANISKLESQIKTMIKGSGLRGQKIDDLLEKIINASEPITLWGTLLNEMEEIAHFDSSSDGETDIPFCPELMASGLTQSDIKKLCDKLTPELWLELVLTALDELTQFEYKTKEQEYIPFEHASAGQQATALLFTLLNQPGPPLIIDQPEDDLDNQIIFNIVERVWKAKSRRQIIFSSHNANLVVNGDAELVVCCDYRTAGDYSRGKISVEGAIDVPEIRDTIKIVMEGGEKAFKLRLDKYGF